MAALPPPPERRRPRHGSLERPVSGRMYRGAWLLAGLPLLAAAFSVAPPSPLPAPALPPTFDQESAYQLSVELARRHPDRSPDSQGAREASRWFSGKLAEYGFRTQSDRFEAEIPGRGRVQLENLVAFSPGRSNQAIVILAHRDNAGTGPGANDNASGTAALIELARAYAAPTGAVAGSSAKPLGPTHTIVFVSTDAGAFGGIGAERFAERSPYRRRTIAAINLVALAGKGPPRLELAGDRPRSPTAALVRTAAARVLEQTGTELVRPGALAQLVDFAFPFSLYEQAPFVGRGIPAITLTTAGARPPASFEDTPERLRRPRLGQLGRSAQAVVGSLDQGFELGRGTASYLYLGSRFVRGWALKLALAAALLPFLVAAVDLFARCRRRRIPLAPALRSYRSRLAFWLWCGALFFAFALAGVWATGAARPISPESSAATDWPLGGLALLGVLSAAGWLVIREKLLPRRPASAEDELAGQAAALLVLGVLGLLVFATNPFALIFVLPSMHAWLWLPQMRGRSPLVRGGLLLAGFAGPLVLIVSFAQRFGLGLDAPWYVAQLTAIGYVHPASVLILCAWLAVAGQLTAVAAGRYAPYPVRDSNRSAPLLSIPARILGAARARQAEQARRRATGG